MFLKKFSVGHAKAQNALEKSKILLRVKIQQINSVGTRYTGKIYDLSYFYIAGIKNFDNFSGLKLSGSDAERIRAKPRQEAGLPKASRGLKYPRIFFSCLKVKLSFFDMQWNFFCIGKST
jgi:hypothetical protein